MGRTLAFKVKAVFLCEGVRIKVGVIGEGELERRDKTIRLYIKSQNHVSKFTRASSYSAMNMILVAFILVVPLIPRALQHRNVAYRYFVMFLR